MNPETRQGSITGEEKNNQNFSVNENSQKHRTKNSHKRGKS